MALRYAAIGGIALAMAISAPAQAATIDAYWTLDDTAADASGHGNTLQLNGSPTYVEGIAGDALRLTGGQSASTLAPPSFDLMASNFTISLWADFDSFNTALTSFDGGSTLGVANTLIAQDDGSGNHPKWVMYYDTNAHGLGFYWGNGTSSTGFVAGVGSTSPAAGAWNMYSITYDPTGLKLYYDGQSIGGNGVFFTAHPTSDITLGIAEGIGQLHGALDDVRIYDGALTAAQVQNLYETTGIPEPSSWAMLLSAAGLCLLGRRRVLARQL
jgi:hypothetical protein